MTQIPDDPRIRDAERNGYGDCPEPTCPVCGAKDVERFYFYKGDRDILGCEECIDWDPAENFNR